MGSCLQCPQLLELLCFLLWVLSVFFYIFHSHRVCLIDCVDLTCSMYSWWESFGSSSLATLPLGFSRSFISTSACGLSTGVCSRGCPGGLGFALMRARCGDEAATWVAGILAVPGTQRSWQLGSRKYSALEGCGNQYWPIHSSILACDLRKVCVTRSCKHTKLQPIG